MVQLVLRSDICGPSLDHGFVPMAHEREEIRSLVFFHLICKDERVCEEKFSHKLFSSVLGVKKYVVTTFNKWSIGI